MERRSYHRRGSLSGPYTYISGNTTQNQYIKFYGVSEGEEQFNDIREME